MNSSDSQNTQSKWIWIGGLLILIASRLITQIFLYSAGFTSLTADEFGRTVLAAQWAQEPFMLWNGPWLPFQTYLYGIALKINWELIIVPRLITIFIGILSIIIMYLFTILLFDNKTIGFISAFLLAVNPAHIWLSSTPLTEIVHTLLIISSMLLFLYYIKNSKIQYLYLSSIVLAFANGFRYEAWMISLVYSLTLLGFGWIKLRDEHLETKFVHLLIAACLPWVFPIAWLAGNYFVTGDPLSGAKTVKLFRISRTGDIKSYPSYFYTLIGIDPFAVLLLIPAAIYAAFQKDRYQGIRWYLLMVFVPLLIFFLVHGGQLEPPGNYIRYLAPFVFLTYPLIAYGIYRITTLFVSQRNFQIIAIILMLLIISGRQVYSAFQFNNDPSAIGLEVGKTLRKLREDDGQSQPAPALIETLMWEYLAFHVGANDVTSIYYDRELNFYNPDQASWFEESESLRNCISYHHAKYIVAKSPELIQSISESMEFEPVTEVNDYSIFTIPSDFYANNAIQSSTCP